MLVLMEFDLLSFFVLKKESFCQMSFNIVDHVC